MVIHSRSNKITNRWINCVQMATIIGAVRRTCVCVCVGHAFCVVPRNSIIVVHSSLLLLHIIYHQNIIMNVYWCVMFRMFSISISSIIFHARALHRAVCCCRCRVRRWTVAFTQNGKLAIGIENGIATVPAKVSMNHCWCTKILPNMRDTSNCNCAQSKVSGIDATPHIEQTKKAPHLKWMCFWIFADEGDINGATAAGSRNPAANNNYELTEFDTRGPTYRYVWCDKMIYTAKKIRSFIVSNNATQQRSILWAIPYVSLSLEW